ncbi:hypothetical protein JQK15_16055 [Sphingobium sp. BHU LFT2]|uniref:hypothetical protein n=1 Tax=Sphingobium sp. BHU LFT2 TaxID=2807634 RepID=UPI001BE93801|nr:hypothetical protein [Sphingobium sp. BHU LFT2]MBT2245053.1 hypothetical protein [Sphingobium sp. BHU LFT2]
MDDASPSAIRTLRLLIGLSIVTAGAAVALALFYLWAIDAPLRPAVVLVATLGVGLTVLVAGGLTALLYYSAQSGHDDRASGGRSDTSNR